MAYKMPKKNRKYVNGREWWEDEEPVEAGDRVIITDGIHKGKIAIVLRVYRSYEDYTHIFACLTDTRERVHLIQYIDCAPARLDYWHHRYYEEKPDYVQPEPPVNLKEKYKETKEMRWLLIEM